MIKYNPYNWEIKKRDDSDIEIETLNPMVVDLEFNEEKLIEDVKQAVLDNIEIFHIE